MKRAAPWWALAVLSFSSLAPGHGFAPTLVELSERGSGEVLLRVKRPLDATDRDEADPALGGVQGCVAAGPSSSLRLPDAVVRRRWIRCGERGLRGRVVELPPSEQGGDALVRVSYADGRVWSTVAHRGARSVTLPGVTGEGTSRVLLGYAGLGVTHLLAGADHLLFVLALLLLVRGAGALVRTVTAFTVGHSVTLGLSALGLVRLRQAPVEAVIALSIALLAVELARDEEAPSWTRRAPWFVAGGFGLLHGFGFAGALREVGFPPGQTALALAGFNLGVELGQLAVIAAGLALARVAPRAPHVTTVARRIAVLGIGAAATYWSLARIAAVWG